MGYSNRDFYEQIHKKLKAKTIVPSIDAHLHLVDFLQEGGNINKLIKEMDEGNIQKAVIFGMPVIKKWAHYQKEKPSYYLSDNAKCYYYSRTDEIVARAYSELPKIHQNKLAPLICGFNPTDMSAVHQIEWLLKKHDCWRGIGEILFRHDDLTNLTMGEVARPNHPAMFPIYELCASKNLPILLHQNATSEWEHETDKQFIHELTEVLDNFPDTKIIWAHCGASRRTNLTHYTGILKDLLEKYPQMSMDISWVVYDDVICENEEPKPRWIELFERYPDRFYIGSDLLGHYEDLGRSMGRYNNLLQKLSKPAAKLIAYENAQRMWFRDKN